MIDKIAGQKSDAPEIQPGNEITVRLFFSVATQWLWVNSGFSSTRVGLNYPAVDVRAKTKPDYLALQPEQQEWVWDGIQRMEAAALKVWNSKD